MNTAVDAPPASLLTRPFFAVFLWVAALLMLATVCVGTIALAWQGLPAQSDFSLLYASALSWLRGGGLYQHFIYAPVLKEVVFLGTPAQPDGFRLMENLNPPVVSFLLLPYALLPIRWAFYLWCATQFVSAYLVLHAIARRCLPASPLRTPGLLLVYCAFFPVLANLLVGQIGLWLVVPLGLGWLALTQGKARQAGLWLGVALLAKLFVGLIFLWLLLTRQWRPLLWGCLVWCIGMFVALLVFGLHDHQNWLKVVAAYNAGSLSWNASLEGVLERYLGTGIILTYYDNPWLCWLLRSLSWSLSAAAFIWLNRRGETALGFALCLPLMLYLAPIGWMYYFPMLFISAMILWREGARMAEPARRYQRYGLALALGLCGVPQMLASGDYFWPTLSKPFYLDGEVLRTSGEKMELVYEHAINWFVLPELYTLGLLLLAFLCVRTAYSLRSTHTGA